MARLLMLADQFPADLTSGRFLRVNHLARELAKRHQSFFVDLRGDTDPATVKEELGVVEALSMPPLPGNSGSMRRHLRISNARYLQLSHPAYVHDTTARLRHLVNRWQIDTLLVFAAEAVAELALGLDLPKIVDICDCATLTRRRAVLSRGTDPSLRHRVRLRLSQMRQGARERALVRGFDLTITIAEPDRQALLQSSGAGQDRIAVVPNGVAREALQAGEKARQAGRSIVFWGNLDFPPNWTAVRYFFETVFVPFLADAGIRWHIYGRGAGENLRDVMNHPGVSLEGFRENLFDEVIERGVMINPMVEGSGLKNKILEAFACRIPVVSTSLGVEALPVTHGKDCLIADDAAGLAASVLDLLDRPAAYAPMLAAARSLVEEQFTWPTVGAHLGAVVDGLASSRRAAACATPPAGGSN